MRNVIMLLLIVVFVNCVIAQNQTISDSTIQKWWKNNPEARSFLKEWFPNTLKTVSLDSTLFEGWKIYSANQGTEYYLVLKIKNDFLAICEIGPDDTLNYAKGFVGKDSCLVVSPRIGNSKKIPQNIQDFIDRLK